MKNGSTVGAVIPTLNEERAIGKVLAALPGWVDQVVVADNGSTDSTAEVARAHGARVTHEPRRGYGAACLRGLETLDAHDIILFLDGDFSDCPQEADRLVDPIASGQADLVVGSRTLGPKEPGALSPQARFGNWLACQLMGLVWSPRFTDLGPFRAIRRTALARLHMQDRDFGWTVEMQARALALGIRVREVPVSYRRRIGHSKISGTLLGIVFAGTRILYTIGREMLRPRPARWSY
jgi:glycosyltransferase involved in cell wall biosynthesis